MLSVSEAWKTAHKDFLAPEGYIEISYNITTALDMTGVGVNAAAAEIDEELSDLADVLSTADFPEEVTASKVATTELNFWELDGSRTLIDNATMDGYTSEELDEGRLVIGRWGEPSYDSIPGITIQFSEEYGEWAEEFTVTAYNSLFSASSGNIVEQTKITGNTDTRVVVDMPVSNFDSIEIVVNKWGIPGHRARIERIALGVVAVFTKRDILSFSHEMTGSLITGELPKNSIEFSLDNTSGRWDPSNPSGYERYLSERQPIRLRYGFDLNGTVEWVSGGQFYLSEWKTPSNGLEAQFVARDMLEFLLNETYTGPKSGRLDEIAGAAGAQAEALIGVDGVYVQVWEGLSGYTASFAEDHTIAEVLQLCANAGCCIILPDRTGGLLITRWPWGEATGEEYHIPLSLSFAYPEYELSKPMRGVSVSYGENKYESIGKASGEVQTIDNPFISTEAQASEVADWVRENLSTRKNVSGEFRCDLRPELYDTVYVETKGHGRERLILTSIHHSFTGAFRTTYSGYGPEVIL